MKTQPITMTTEPSKLQRLESNVANLRAEIVKLNAEARSTRESIDDLKNQIVAEEARYASGFSDLGSIHALRERLPARRYKLDATLAAIDQNQMLVGKVEAAIEAEKASIQRDLVVTRRREFMEILAPFIDALCSALLKIGDFDTSVLRGDALRWSHAAMPALCGVDAAMAAQNAHRFLVEILRDDFSGTAFIRQFVSAAPHLVTEVMIEFLDRAHRKSEERYAQQRRTEEEALAARTQIPESGRAALNFLLHGPAAISGSISASDSSGGGFSVTIPMPGPRAA